MSASLICKILLLFVADVAIVESDWPTTAADMPSMETINNDSTIVKASLFLHRRKAEILLVVFIS